MNEREKANSSCVCACVRKVRTQKRIKVKTRRERTLRHGIILKYGQIKTAGLRADGTFLQSGRVTHRLILQTTDLQHSCPLSLFHSQYHYHTLYSIYQSIYADMCISVRRAENRGKRDVPRYVRTAILKYRNKRRTEKKRGEYVGGPCSFECVSRVEGRLQIRETTK